MTETLHTFRRHVSYRAHERLLAFMRLLHLPAMSTISSLRVEGVRVRIFQRIKKTTPQVALHGKRHDLIYFLGPDSEISKFAAALRVEEEVTWLHITVDDASGLVEI